MNPVDLLHPEIAAAVSALPIPDLTDEVVEMIRSAYLPAPPLSDAVVRTEHVVPGDPPVPVRVHRVRDAEGVLPCLYSIHGGGYVIGTYAMQDAPLDRLCQSLGLVGVAPEYRLAP